MIGLDGGLVGKLEVFMTKKYVFDRKSVWNYFLKINITTLSIVISGSLLYIYIKNIKSFETIVYGLIGALLGWFLIFAIPVILLFFNHKKHSMNIIFSINSNNYFKYVNGHDVINFFQEDIEKVELWLTPPAYDNRIDFGYFGKYHFTKIYTKQNQIINLSCLICDETEQIFNKDLIVRKKKLFPLMKQNKI